MNKNDPEGVIKFDLVYEKKPLPEIPGLQHLIAWRSLLHRLHLIGRDPGRYAGLGFGNISLNLASSAADTEPCPFVISGTQTGDLECLGEAHFCVVTGCSIPDNRIVAEGLVRPSSEALTHAAVYRCDPKIRCVMHVHSPEIWRATRMLVLPTVDETIAYGTREMADAVRSLILPRKDADPGIFSMLGHEDGIVAYADSIAGAGHRLVETFVRVLALGNR